MEEWTPTVSRTDAERGATVTQILINVLPAVIEAGRDPWDAAEQAGNHKGFRGAPLVGANALRWAVAHGYRRMGLHGLARAMMSELVIDCDEIGGYDG